MNTVKKRPRRNIIYLLFSLTVTIGVFSYLFTHVSPSETINLIRNINKKILLIFLSLSFSMSVFRTWRYKVVLRVSGHNPNSIALFLIVIVRNFFSDLLPARLGTLIYVYLVTNRLGIPFGAAAASFALSFVFDLIALAPLILIAALLVGVSTGISSTVLFTGGCVFALILLLVLFALPRLFHAVTIILNKLVSLSKGKLNKCREAWVTAEEEIQKARAAGIYSKLIVLSLLVRITKYGSLYFLLFALMNPLGYSLRELNIGKVFTGLCAAEFTASLPISGIAGFGAYEGTWAFVFQVLGFPGHIAKLTSVSHHLFTQVYGYLLGVIALLILLLPVFKNRVKPATTKQQQKTPQPNSG